MMIHAMDVEAWESVGRMLRVFRGGMTVVEASHRAGVSRGWWQKAEKGFEGSLPDEAKLAAAVRAVGADLDAVFAAVGYDPEPFRPTAVDETGDPRVPPLIDLVKEIAERLAVLEDRFQQAFGARSRNRPS